MSVAREAGFSERDQLLTHNASTVLKVHTASDITTLGGTHIKPGIVDRTLDNIIS